LGFALQIDLLNGEIWIVKLQS